MTEIAETYIRCGSFLVRLGRVCLAALATFSGGAAYAGSSSTQVADPQIVYLNNRGEMTVANIDGSLPTVLAGAGVHRPSWSRQGGYHCTSSTTPCRIIYEASICRLSRMDVVVAAGIPKASGITALDARGTSECGSEFSPAGTTFAYTEALAEFPPSSLWLANTDSGDDIGSSPLYTANTAGVTDHNTAESPTFNQDGSKIAFIDEDRNAPNTRTIKIINTDGTGVWDLNVSTTLGLGYLEWSPLGDFLTASSGDGYIYNIQVSPGSQPFRVVAGFYSSFSADGSKLFYGSSSGISSIHLSPTGTASGSASLVIRNASRPKVRHPTAVITGIATSSVRGRMQTTH